MSSELLSGGDLGRGFKFRKKLKKLKKLRKNKLFYAGLSAVVPGAAPALAVANSVSGDAVGKGFKKKLKKVTKVTKKVAKNKWVQRAALVTATAAATVAVVKNADKIKNAAKSVKKKAVGLFSSAPAASATADPEDTPEAAAAREEYFDTTAKKLQRIKNGGQSETDPTVQSNAPSVSVETDSADDQGSEIAQTPAAVRSMVKTVGLDTTPAASDQGQANSGNGGMSKALPMLALAAGALFLLRK
jgi:hypothetical protein